MATVKYLTIYFFLFFFFRTTIFITEFGNICFCFSRAWPSTGWGWAACCSPAWTPEEKTWTPAAMRNWSSVAGRPRTIANCRTSTAVRCWPCYCTVTGWRGSGTTGWRWVSCGSWRIWRRYDGRRMNPVNSGRDSASIQCKRGFNEFGEHISSSLRPSIGRDSMYSSG